MWDFFRLILLTREKFRFLIAMACSLRTGLCISGTKEAYFRPRSKGVRESCASVASSELKESLVLSSRLMGKHMFVTDQKCYRDWSFKSPNNFSVHVSEPSHPLFVAVLSFIYSVSPTLTLDLRFQAQASICVSRAQRWWEKTLKPNMIEIHSAQELVDSLQNAGDRLVVVDFYSRGCGGCRALHPKV